jgi:hypothetical protein
MGALVEQLASVPERVHFMLLSRSYHPIAEGPVCEAAKPAETPRRNNLAHRQVGGVEAMRTAGNKHDSVALGRFDHPLAFFQRHGERFLHDDVLAMVRQCYRMLTVVFGRSGDPYRLDLQVAAELVEASVPSGPETGS